MSSNIQTLGALPAFGFTNPPHRAQYLPWELVLGVCRVVVFGLRVPERFCKWLVQRYGDGKSARTLLEGELLKRGAGANVIIHGRNRAGAKGHVWNAYNNGDVIQYFDISHSGQQIPIGEQLNLLEDFWYLPVD